MMEFGYKFKSSLFGFSKKDVVKCIKELNEAHQEALSELEEEGRAVEAEKRELDAKLSEAHGAVVELKRQLEEAEKKNTALEAVVRRLVENRNENETEISQLKQRVAAQNNQNAELLLKNNELYRKLEEANSKVEKYDALTKDISDVMLEAQQMSLRLKEEAGEEASRIVEDAKQSAVRVRGDLEQFQRRVSQISRSLEQLTASLHEEVVKIERSFSDVTVTLDSLGVPEKPVVKAERDPKLERPVAPLPKKTGDTGQAAHRNSSTDFLGKFREWLK
jgi:chromosome segregation ATPase